MSFILGKKIGMSQVFNEEKHLIPVTIIKAGPCLVTQVKTEEKDGYNSVQVGFEFKKKINKPMIGHLKKVKKAVVKNGLVASKFKENLNFRYLKEFRVEKDYLNKVKIGDQITVSCFQEREKVDIQGTSKAKGFQGVVKRWNFKGRGSSHGVKHEKRKAGSIGIQGVDRVMKGKKMPGRMGGDTVTTKNLQIVKIDEKNDLMIIKGAVTGQNNKLLKIRLSK